MGQALNFSKAHQHDAAQNARLDALLERFYGFYQNEIDLGLSRIAHVLGLLENPQNDIAPAVHIAGTNGKGSTLAFLQAILQGEGQRIHKMSSPHLVSFHERLYVSGAFITTQDLLTLLEGLEPLYKENEVSFFEAVTAATYKVFSDNPADFCLIETGMGGRFDATNVIEKPALTIITTISRDHENFLGSDIAKIAWEKAGILKAGVPCIVAPQIFPEALDVIRKVADEVGAPLYCAGQDWFIDNDQSGNACLFLEPKHGWPINEAIHILPALPLDGQHQYGNAAAALLGAKVLLSQKRQENVSIAHLCAHLLNTKWPARMQCLDRHPYKALIDQRDALWLDGAHNDSAALALAVHLRKWKAEEDCAIYMVAGMINTKNPEVFFAPLRGCLDGIASVPVPSDWRGFAAGELLDIACPDKSGAGENTCQRLGAYENVEEALDYIAQNIHVRSDKKAYYLICGSLYLAGSVLGADEHAENYFS
jgi:dihydrofolate synthase/folylpolyglutamate synthase